MTDIQKRRDDVIEAAKGYEPVSQICSDIYYKWDQHNRLRVALLALRAAEAAEEAARKPRLTSRDAFLSNMGCNTPTSHVFVAARDAEWLAAINIVLDVYSDDGTNPITRGIREDIAALVESASG